MRSWGSSSGTWRDVVEISSEVGAKMDVRWVRLAQSWRQVATEMGHDSCKMSNDSGKIAILESTWELLGWFWEYFWLTLAP